MIIWGCPSIVLVLKVLKDNSFLFFCRDLRYINAFEGLEAINLVVNPLRDHWTVALVDLMAYAQRNFCINLNGRWSRDIFLFAFMGINFVHKSSRDHRLSFQIWRPVFTESVADLENQDKSTYSWYCSTTLSHNILILVYWMSIYVYKPNFEGRISIDK